MEHSAPKRLATWNPARDVWETPETEGLFCEHLDVSSETWPSSGMTRGGTAYVLPTWEERTGGSGSSSSPLLQTPVASEGSKPSNTMGVARRLETGQVFLTNQIVTLCGLDPSETQDSASTEPRLLPTPISSDANGAANPNRPGHVTQLRDAGAPPAADLTLLPTPRAQAREHVYAREDHHNNLEEILGYLHEGLDPHPSKRQGDGGLSLLPTPTVSTAKAARQSTSTGFANDTLDDIRVKVSWGDYAAAIARWEHIIGRPAPDPTESGANGNPRLSAAFVEWLMGLPEGHVTDPAIGLTRNQALKALGNGVVPAQSAAATRAFLADTAEAVAS